MSEMRCPYCDRDVDPRSADAWQRVYGWQKIAGVRSSGKHGGSDIRMRQVSQLWAHGVCITLAQHGRLGQEPLL